MKQIQNAKVIVVKVGTSTLTYPSGMLNLRRIDSLVKTLCDLQNAGHQMILVSSGAVSAGLAKIGFLRRPDSTEEKQAAAAVGQCELMDMYDQQFANYGITVAQILLTKTILENGRIQNVKNCFQRLMDMEWTWHSVRRLGAEAMVSFFLGGLALGMIFSPITYFLVRRLVLRYRSKW